ncbi:alpha/beta hydrolase [Methylomicrobium sp. Wu6]|uniref:alpha/beta fold hydrolase n=1 Tax=Methylomicrobium sp. Wu6 TaxID=3107928 RepID=UPI002DD6A430|nr:alpha/beta hydrolase [Methylomicrobium sp. Wu6]MEC4750111.1 alpha/beta hydrolase [Methylomicrobium sp. Wu6]
MRRLILLCWLPLLSAGCAAPEIRLDREAERLGLTRSLVKGTDYQHVVYRNRAGFQNGELHVYLDGDGSPWIHHQLIADNPTPRNPLVLRLISQDPSASLYLGRPCYHGFGTKPPCTAELWTLRRYSKTVVDTMTAALRELRNALHPRKTVLIGFSGGAALAMLLAERMDGLSGIVTIAGNLDPDAWAERHHYSPLTGSENPAKHPPLSDKIFQLHLAGAKDTNIPPDLIRAAVQRQPSATFIVLPDADHDCCWEKLWPPILETIKAR